MSLCIKRRPGEGLRVRMPEGRYLDIFIMRQSAGTTTFAIEGDRQDKVYRTELLDPELAEAFLAEHFPEAVA